MAGKRCLILICEVKFKACIWLFAAFLLGNVSSSHASSPQEEAKAQIQTKSSPLHRQAWIDARCSQSHDDPQCDEYARKRAALKHVVDVCAEDQASAECISLKESRSKNRYLDEINMEIRAYCRQNPEAPRCQAKREIKKVRRP